MDFLTHNGELLFYSTDVYGIGARTVTFTITILIGGERVGERTFEMTLVNPCSSVVISIDSATMLGGVTTIEYEIYGDNQPMVLIFDPSLVVFTPDLPVCPDAKVEVVMTDSNPIIYPFFTPSTN